MHIRENASYGKDGPIPMQAPSPRTEGSKSGSWFARSVGVCAHFMLAVSTMAAHASGPPKPQSTDSASKNRALIWSDEFNGPDGSLPDPAKWQVIENGSGFGNRELEYYTGRPANIQEENGKLVITARKESFAGRDGISRDYTSARIESQGRFELTYGRIEARIKLPKGQGIWPAFWLLGTDFDHIGWPACGEIDIMENVGYEPSRIHGSLHGPGYSGGSPLTGTYSLPNQARFSDGFHVFAIEWEPQTVRFYVDDILYETQTAENLPPGTHWAFDHPFFVVLNVAVGGYWPGNPDSTTPFPVNMLVDYVRVYRLREESAEKGKP
ncbi:MAG: glycoside hydrolase family 16 protein [Terracidiphilus sp.]